MAKSLTRKIIKTQTLAVTSHYIIILRIHWLGEQSISKNWVRILSWRILTNEYSSCEFYRFIIFNTFTNYAQVCTSIYCTAKIATRTKILSASIIRAVDVKIVNVFFDSFLFVVCFHYTTVTLCMGITCKILLCTNLLFVNITFNLIMYVLLIWQQYTYKHNANRRL